MTFDSRQYGQLALRGDRFIAISILELGARWGVVGQRHAPAVVSP